MSTSLPLVNVRAHFSDQGGRPICGVVVKMRLNSMDKHMGFIVPREEMQVTDAQGNAVLRVFPNVEGYEGTCYDVHVSFPGQPDLPPHHCRPPMPPHMPGCRPDEGVFHDNHCVGFGHQFDTAGRAMPDRPQGFDPHRPILPPHMHDHHNVPLFRAQHFQVTVPNSDCNLNDIVNLPPADQRPMADVLPAEVAGYAAQAASAADAASNYAQAAASSQALVDSKLQEMDAIKDAAQSAQNTATHAVEQAKHLLGHMNDVSCHFEHTVTERVEQTAQRLQKGLQDSIGNQQAIAIQAIDRTRDEALHIIEHHAIDAKADATKAVNEAKELALHLIEDERVNAVADVRDVAGHFVEDVENLAQRAEGSAQRAACSATSAANSATKSCMCAERSEAAMHRAEDAAEVVDDAAKRAESARDQVAADAQKAEAAADSAVKHADYAEGSAKAAQKAIEAADASAQLAKTSAEQAVAAQQAVAADKEYIDSVVDNAKQAVKDVAVELLIPEVITPAAEAATQLAQNAAAEAKKSADDAADYAKTAHDFADSSAYWAEESKKSGEAAHADAEIAASKALLADASASAAAADAEEAKTAAEAAREKAGEAVQAVIDAGLEADRAKAEADRAASAADGARAKVEEAISDIVEGVKADAERAETAADNARENVEAAVSDIVDGVKADADRAEAAANSTALDYANLQAQVTRLLDRLTKVELDHATSAHPCPGSGGEGGGSGIGADEIKEVFDVLFDQRKDELKGEPGAPGDDGLDGKTWKPSVSATGLLSWNQDESTNQPASYQLPNTSTNELTAMQVQQVTRIVNEAIAEDNVSDAANLVSGLNNNGTTTAGITVVEGNAEAPANAAIVARIETVDD